jgi:hypothetical protein
MIFGTFIVYVLVFSLLFLPGLKSKGFSGSMVKLLVIPVLLGALLLLLTVIKVYFLYKFLIILFISAITLLSYWQWGEKIRQWWR